MRSVSLVTHRIMILGVALMLVMLFGVPSRATATQAPPTAGKILAVTLDLDASGLVTVTEHHTWRIDPSESQNIVRQLPLFAPYSGELMKKFEYTNFEVSSPQEDYDLKVLDNGSELEVRMTKSATTEQGAPLPVAAEPDLTLIDVTLTYDVKGVLSTTLSADGAVRANEFFWSILSDSKVDYTSLDYTVTAPARALDSECILVLPPPPEDILTLTPTCAEQSSDENLSYQAAPVPLGTSIDSRVTFPAGTFDRTASLTVDWTDAQQDEDPEDADSQVPFDPTWTENLDEGLAETNDQTLPIIVGLVVVAIVAAFVIFTRRRGDYRFTAGEPGQVPSTPESHPVERAPQTISFVRTATPPIDLSVAEAGAVLSAGLRGKEVTATLVDLAVRHALSITELPSASGPLTWRITTGYRLQDLTLQPHEQALIDALFAHGDEIETVSMHANFALGALDVLRTLGQEIANREFFKQLLEHESTGREHRKQRTALGRVYLEQLCGFREFLSAPTPEELDQLVSQSTITEVFCSYLPLALSCDQAVAWANACDAYVATHAESAFREEISWFTVDGINWDGTFSKLVDRISRLVKTGY